MTIKQLEKKIKEAQNAYYNSDSPIMSDSEFDSLWDELLEKDPDNPIFTKIGEDSSEGFKKGKHKIVAGSQQKAINEEQITKLLKKSSKNVMVSEKLDGSSIVLYYVKGKLDCAISRGNGCLSRETLLDTDKGRLTIEQIVENRIQCRVKSYDFKINKIIYTNIYDWFINENSEDWYELKLENGTKIKLTGNHLVFCTNKNTWIRVDQLNENDKVQLDEI